MLASVFLRSLVIVHAMISGLCFHSDGLSAYGAWLNGLLAAGYFIAEGVVQAKRRPVPTPRTERGGA